MTSEAAEVRHDRVAGQESPKIIMNLAMGRGLRRCSAWERLWDASKEWLDTRKEEVGDAAKSVGRVLRTLVVLGVFGGLIYLVVCYVIPWIGGRF